MQRRYFLKAAGALAAVAVTPHHIWAQEIYRASAGLSILQGLTTETTTQLTIDLPAQLNVEYTLVDRQTNRVFTPTWVRNNRYSGLPVRADRVFFSGLELGHYYQFNIKDVAQNRNLDERYLTTLDLSRSNFKIAVMSCMKDSVSNLGRMWSSAEAANADYYFMIGDVIYGDVGFSHGPDRLWNRFVESRVNIPFYRWKNLKPVIATWDDHDYGKNNEDGGYEHKVSNLRTFKSFFGQEALGTTFLEGPGNSYRLRAFNHNFLFLDSRYFRGLNGGFLGNDQLQWVRSAMLNASGPTWVMEGSPFFGRADKSNTSYESTSPSELQTFLSEVNRWNSPAVFMGGDLHYSEVSKLKRGALSYDTYEFISSCMHSSAKSSYNDNANEHVNGSFRQNFLLFEKNGLVTDANWKVSCVGESSRIHFEGQFNV